MGRKPIDKPNILIIVIDSLRADHVSCYGYHRETTPNIDRLASQGCLFETCITAAPFSPASYASIFSNLYPHQHGVNGDTVRVWPNHFRRLAELMKANGYFTFGASNNDFVSTSCNATQGFDRFIDVWEPGWLSRQHQRLTSRIRNRFGDTVAGKFETNHLKCLPKGDSAQSVRVIRSLIRDSQKPFFGFVVFMDPHIPYNKKRRRFVRTTEEWNVFIKTCNRSTMWAEMMANHRKPNDTRLQHVLDSYDSEIVHADYCVGQLIQWLSDQRLLDDTIVVVTADHGEAFGEHDVWGHGFSLNDCLARVPLLIRCPRYWQAGVRSKALVQLHDLHALCLSVSASGEPQPDLHPHCLSQAADHAWMGREAAYSEFPSQTKTLELFHKLNPAFEPGDWAHDMWAVRTKDWRYIEYDSGECRLYDLARDPGETESVHDQHRDTCMEWHARLETHRNDRPHDVDAAVGKQADAIDAAVLDRLRALGYVE